MANHKTKFPSVMLVDDNEIDNFINQKMIEGSGFSNRVYIHTSSKSALEFLKNIERDKQFPQELVPGMIFLDINMPIMDGFQFVDEFDKLKGDLREKIQIVMLSTSINPSDVEYAEKNPSILKFLNKPLLEEHLGKL